jgi:hypothetical protein
MMMMWNPTAPYEGHAGFQPEISAAKPGSPVSAQVQ